MAHIRPVGNFETQSGRNVLEEVITDLHRAIAHFSAKERRTVMLTRGNDEKLLAALDLLTLMAEHYQISIELDRKTVRRWRNICLENFAHRSTFEPAEDVPGWNPNRREIIINVFAHLESVAALYPQFDWAGKNPNHQWTGGSWGIIEGDYAQDFFFELQNKLLRIIVSFLADETLIGWTPSDKTGYIAAAAEILAKWGEHYGSLSAITAQAVRHWRALSLKQLETDFDWDNTLTIDGLDARTERRKAIEATFDRLEAVALDDKLLS
jgi:hypothetical protein